MLTSINLITVVKSFNSLTPLSRINEEPLGGLVYLWSNPIARLYTSKQNILLFLHSLSKHIISTFPSIVRYAFHNTRILHK